jgi:hypothetical protein
MKKYVVRVAAITAATLSLSTIALADPAPQMHVRGTISAVKGNRLTIATAKGPVVVMIDAKTHVAGVLPATVDQISPGTFIGTANVPGPGAARALEVVVFPKAMAGTGEGDYPWDLPAGGNAMSAMTNGTVLKPKHSSMTNATVTKVANGPIKTVSLAYKGGTKMVAIPPGAPIVRVVPANKGLLVVGAHVVAFPPTSAAPFVIVGEQGTVPPM